VFDPPLSPSQEHTPFREMDQAWCIVMLQPLGMKQAQKKKKRAMEFQTSTTSHTKVTRLERNALLGRGMDLNSLTWLLVTCVLFQMYTTPALIQSTYSYGNVTTWHPDQVHLPIFNTLHFTLSVRGGEVPCNLTQVVFDTPGGTSAFGETITTFYESTQLDSGEPNTPCSSNTFSNSIPCVSNYLWGFIAHLHH
jgi:hypothetical protein